MPSKREISLDGVKAEEPSVAPAKKKAKKLEGTFPEAEAGETYTLPSETSRSWKYFFDQDRCGVIYKSFGVAQGGADGRAKVAAFDLDGTLIRPKSGNRFPINEKDWTPFNPKVFKTLQKFHDDGYRVVIFSNQTGMGAKVKGKKSATIRKKLDLIDEALRGDRFKKGGLTFPFIFFCAPGTPDDARKNPNYKKPAPGMFEVFTERFNANFSVGAGLDMEASFYCGDMAGRPGDIDVTDKEFANAVGLRHFKTPEEIFGESSGKTAVEKREIGGESGGVNHNQALCDIFLKISEKLVNLGEKFKAKAFKNAAETLQVKASPFHSPTFKTRREVREELSSARVGRGS
mmetsp:Transcript_35323/g.76680  ORF Transcript_35323/g.76680 Transcript_35323/m.76680 type:complete len:346 (-) Transcript_35323:406-1443(-)